MNYTPKMHSDLSLSERDSYIRHKNFITQEKYADAAKVISDNEIDGCTASLLNGWENALKEIENTGVEYTDPYVYKQTEPTITEMTGKMVWQQEY